MKTSTVIVAALFAASGICLGRTPDGEIQESLGASFGYVVKERPAIVARMNAEMDQLTDFFFTPEVAAGLHVILEPGNDKQNTNGYWIHLHGMKSLWRAIGMDKRTAFLDFLGRRYDSLATAAKKGEDITRPDTSALPTFLAAEHNP